MHKLYAVLRIVGHFVAKKKRRAVPALPEDSYLRAQPQRRIENYYLFNIVIPACLWRESMVFPRHKGGSPTETFGDDGIFLHQKVFLCVLCVLCVLCDLCGKAFSF